MITLLAVPTTDPYAAEKLWLQVAVFLTTLVAGIFAGYKWIAERRDDRASRESIELARLDEQKERRRAEGTAELIRLDQERVAEKTRRSERAAELIRDFGAAKEPAARLTTAMALTAYPDDAVPILVNSLGYTGEDLSPGIEAALLTLGILSMDRLVTANRLATRLSGEQSAGITQPTAHFDAETLLQHTRRLITLLLLQAHQGDAIQLDLADVNLAGMRFVNARMQNVNLRKAVLDGANFSGSRLTGASFRGASIHRTNFGRAFLDHADLSGAHGNAICIGMRGRGLILDYAKLSGSDFRGAGLDDLVLRCTDIRRATLDGLRAPNATLLAHSRLDGSTAAKAVLTQSSWIDATATKLQFDACNIAGSSFLRTTLDQSCGRQVLAKGIKLEESSVRGGKWIDSQLRKAKFIASSLQGLNLEGSDMREAIVDNCDLSGARLVNVQMHGMRFINVGAWSETTNFAGSNWLDADFDQQSQPFRRWLMSA